MFIHTLFIIACYNKRVIREEPQLPRITKPLLNKPLNLLEKAVGVMPAAFSCIKTKRNGNNINAHKKSEVFI